MNSGKQCVGDDLESLSFVSEHLSMLKSCIQQSEQFAANFNRHLNAKDRLELSATNTRLSEMYWRLFEKFIKKVRGI